MKRFELDERDEKVLSALAQHGAMSPSQVAAETWVLPVDMKTVLHDLSFAGLVVLREDTNSPDGMLVTITNEARYYLNGNLKKK